MNGRIKTYDEVDDELDFFPDLDEDDDMEELDFDFERDSYRDQLPEPPYDDEDFYDSGDEYQEDDVDQIPYE